MSFGKSKARLISKDESHVTFEDVAGVDEAKEEVGELVDFLSDPSKFTKVGGKIPRLKLWLHFGLKLLLGQCQTSLTPKLQKIY